jgi:hypothetical protein|tara:strand:- start:460 stop:2025 length:1566 start_codon:yes stop_codon:yes gene_type:complete
MAEDKDFWDKVSDTGGKVWDGMNWLDKASIVTAPVPLLGDVVGGVADATNIIQQYNKTGEIPWSDVGLSLTGLFPFLPARAVTGNLKKSYDALKDNAKQVARKGVHNAPNYLPAYYSGGLGGKIAGMTYGGTQMLKNMTKQAYSPKAQGLWEDRGISLTDQKVAQESLEKMRGTYRRSTIDKVEEFLTKDAKTGKRGDVTKGSDKKAMGQINQSRLFDSQYGTNESFYKVLDGLDQKAFADLDGATYFKVMKKATGLDVKTINAVFDQIKKIQNVDPKKAYRMAIRRPSTQSSGNLNNLTGPAMFGGKGLNNLKQVFNTGVPFKTNKGLLAGLKAKGIRVTNADLVLKNDVPPIITGSKHSDAYELGGVNYMTVVQKDGRTVSFMNDGNDLAGLPATRVTKKIEFQAPLADRMMSVSTPIHFDLMNRGTKPRGVKQALNKLADEKRVIADNVESTMAKLGVDVTEKIPKGTVLNRAQFATIKGIAEATGEKTWKPVAANYVKSGVRMAKPINRGFQNSPEE